MNTYNIELTAEQINIIVAGVLKLPGAICLPVYEHLKSSVETIDRERAEQADKVALKENDHD